MSIAWN